MKSDYELSLRDYIAIIKDRALLLGVSIVVILAATVAVAVMVPPIYQSTGTILVESQQISPELVSTNNTSFADERIEVIRQRVMTRENLLRIIDKYNLFPDKRFSDSDKIDHMRSAIVVETLTTYVRGRGEATVAFNVSFEHKQPEVAKEVADELVTLFLTRTSSSVPNGPTKPPSSSPRRRTSWGRAGQPGKPAGGFQAGPRQCLARAPDPAHEHAVTLGAGVPRGRP